MGWIQVLVGLAYEDGKADSVCMVGICVDMFHRQMLYSASCIMNYHARFGLPILIVRFGRIIVKAYCIVSVTISLYITAETAALSLRLTAVQNRSRDEADEASCP